MLSGGNGEQMDFLRKLFLVFAGVWFLLLGSCAMIGLSTAYAVNSVSDSVQDFAGSEFGHKLEREHIEHQRRAHNEEINRESRRYSENRERSRYYD